jgi:hypothetical protein
MAAPSDPQSESVNERLADFVCARKDEIIRAWVGRIQADESMKTEELTTNQIRDHLPRLLDDLADTLRRLGNDRVVEQTAEDAEKHGAERWQQGYNVAKLLREIMHLREIFIYHLRIFEDTHTDLGTPARLFTHSSVHHFLDELGINAIERFLASEKRARREASGLAV